MKQNGCHVSKETLKRLNFKPVYDEELFPTPSVVFAIIPRYAMSHT